MTNFPPVIVLIKNMNNFDFVHPYGGEDVMFPRNVAVRVSPEVAHTLLAWDTRNVGEDGQPALTRDDKPNPRDRNISYYDVCNLRYGWANNPEREQWLRNFEAELLPIEAQIPGERFDQIRASNKAKARARRVGVVVQAGSD